MKMKNRVMLTAALTLVPLVGIGVGSASADTGGTWQCRGAVYPVGNQTYPCIATTGGDIWGGVQWSDGPNVDLYIDVYQATPGHLGSMVAQNHGMTGTNLNWRAVNFGSFSCNTYLVAEGFWDNGVWHGIWESPIEANC
jgi:hypothetical protein